MHSFGLDGLGSGRDLCEDGVGILLEGRGRQRRPGCQASKG